MSDTDTEAAALRTERDRLLAVVSGAGARWVWFGRDGSFLGASPDLAEWLGVDAAPAASLTERIALLAPDAAGREALQRTFAEDASAPDRAPARHVRLQPPGRDALWVRARMTRGPGDTLVIVLVDVSDREQDREERRRTESRFRELVDNAADAIVVSDPQYRVLEVNRRCCEMLGYTREELLAMPFAEALAPGDLDRRPAVYLASDGLRGLHSERWVRRRDGTVFPVEARTNLTESGEVMIILRDVTERYQAEAERARRAAELEAANAELERLHLAREEFLAKASHELRTPLVTGMGYLELALDGSAGRVPQAVASRLRVAHRNLRRLSALIDGLVDPLAWSGQGLPGAAPAPVPVNLAALAAEGVAEFLVRRSVAPERVDLAVPADMPAVRFDPDQLKMVLANLLDNAERHAGPTARLRVAARPREPGGVEVAVADDGVGIPEEVRPRVFEPFVKGPGTREGSGLGLAIVRGVLAAHGVAVELDSGPGRGTVVRFVLPVA